MKRQPDAFTEEELADIGKALDVEAAKRRFETYRSDGAKCSYISTATNEEILKFLEIWARKGIEHPDVYLLATVRTSGMLYVPFLKFTYYVDQDLVGRAETYAEHNPEFDVELVMPENLVELNHRLEYDSIESKISDLPVISLFFTQGFYGGWVPFGALVSMIYVAATSRRKDGKRKGDSAATSSKAATDQALPNPAVAIPIARDTASLGQTAPGQTSATPMPIIGLIPVLVSVALLLLSPVASPRYVLPLLYTSPLQIGWAYCMLQWKSMGTR